MRNCLTDKQVKSMKDMVGTSVCKVTRRLMPWLRIGYVSMSRNVSGNEIRTRHRATHAVIRNPCNILIFRSIGDKQKKTRRLL